MATLQRNVQLYQPTETELLSVFSCFKPDLYKPTSPPQSLPIQGGQRRLSDFFLESPLNHLRHFFGSCLSVLRWLKMVLRTWSFVLTTYQHLPRDIMELDWQPMRVEMFALSSVQYVPHASYFRWRQRKLLNFPIRQMTTLLQPLIDSFYNDLTCYRDFIGYSTCWNHQLAHPIMLNPHGSKPFLSRWRG